ncbi:MAG: GxxExxY protein [Candidatus Margulisiibacteriota bacterium]
MSDLIHPELSYKLIGALYRVYNELGGGYQENIYQRAVRKELIRSKIGFIEQVDTQLQSKLELGILASMNRNGIIFKRILRGRDR